jgi:lipid-binding SYLF domain-containing protein
MAENPIFDLDRNKIRRSGQMRFRTVIATLAVMFTLITLASAGDSRDEQRKKIRKMADAVLKDLYKLQPPSREFIQKSAGYAVFDNTGVNVLLLSTARGGGLAVNTKTKHETFMKMISAGAGIGLGVKDYRVVFVFGSQQALEKFVTSGWAAEAQADAAAKTSEAGGAYSGATMVAPDVWVYQITKKGLALQATLQGTKYYKNDDLNQSAGQRTVADK